MILFLQLITIICCHLLGKQYKGRADESVKYSSTKIR